jgi:hypothetical protein
MSGDPPRDAANEHPTKYWESGDQWFELAWNDQLGRYVPREVHASEVPTSQGGTGPG